MNPVHIKTLHLHFVFGLWDDHNSMPFRFRACLFIWRILHPSWKITLWNKSLCEDLLRQYPTYSLNYHKLEKAIQKADFIRYLIVFHHGGIYADLDVFPLSLTLKKICAANKSLFVVETMLDEKKCNEAAKIHKIRKGKPELPIRIANYFFYSPGPGCSVLKNCLDLVAVRSKLKCLSDYDVIYITGPDALTEVVHQAPPDQVLILQKNEADELIFHAATGTWRTH